MKAGAKTANRLSHIPTLKDVAAKAGVSHTAVSLALRGVGGNRLAERVRLRILKIAKELDYQTHRSGLALRAQKTRVVGFVAHGAPNTEGLLQNFAVQPFIVGLNHRLLEDGYHVAYLELPELDQGSNGDLPTVLRERFFDGLVVHYGLSDKARRLFSHLRIPVIWWDSGLFKSTNCIYRDEERVTHSVIKRLFQLGHRRISYMVGQAGWEKYLRGQLLHFSFPARYQTYRDEMLAAGQKPVEIVGYEVAGLIEQLNRQRCTAVITGGRAYIPPALAEAAARLGKRIPEDLSVVSLDVEARLPEEGFGVAGMTYDRYRAGRQAAEMLLQMLEGAVKAVPSLKLQGEFREGATLGPICAAE